MKRHKQVNIGSVSCATMKTDDLIPAFLYELRYQKPLRQQDAKLVKEIEERMESDDYYESEDSDCDLESLFDALDNYSAPFMYFGAHEGDGADYGYWVSWDAIRDAVHDGEMIEVSDLCEIPTDYVGDVIHTNDHGNATLYRRGRNHRVYKVWAIV